MKERNCKHLVSSSGGNAGCAVAYVGKKLNCQVTVVVPETTPQLMRERLSNEGASVVVHGSVWAQANEFAKKIASQPNSTLIHPFDDPEIWLGHSTIIRECSEIMKEKPSAVICTVGGGGLMCGILEGLHHNGWQDVPLIAVETKGADKLNLSLAKGDVVTLQSITSIAKSLGASRICDAAWEWTKKHKIYSRVVTDSDAVQACLRFANDHRFLVEPACGAGLALVYNHQKYLDDIDLTRGLIVIVCGGNIATIELLQQWIHEYSNK